VSGIPNQSSSYDNDDRLLADGWDANGNTLTINGNQYGYDSENRLLALNTSQAHYIYDGDGQLVSKMAGGVTINYLVDDQTPAGYTQIAEERVSGAVAKSYVYGPQRISMRDGSGLYYYGTDAHSGVRLLLGSSGNITDTWDYDAFGKVIARTGSTTNDFTYRGEQMDSALGLQYLRARWVDPGKGRLWTRDTWEGLNREPLGLNGYSYAMSDPINQIDPSGNISYYELSAAMASLGVLANMALPRLQVLLQSAYLNLNRVPQIIETASNWLTIGSVAGEVLTELGRNVLRADREYSRGWVTRGIQVGHAAQQNLSDTFPKIDHFDEGRGVAVQIKSTSQVDTASKFMGIVRSAAQSVSQLPARLPGKTAGGLPIVIERSQIKQIGLLVVIPDDIKWSLRSIRDEIAQIELAEKVAIVVQPVRGLRGGP
jgi:RHS repeat-associated protein